MSTLICPHCQHEDEDAATNYGQGNHEVECANCGKPFSCSINMTITIRAWVGRRRLAKTNTSGFRGVSLHTTTGRWLSHISYGGKTRHLGLFDSAEDAARAYDAAAIKHHGRAKLNFNRLR